MPETPPKNLNIKRVSIDSLHPDPANARTHDELNLDAISASLKRFGQAEPLVVQASTGRIIGGNGRLVAMKKLGWTECEIVELDIDDLTATALGIALNRTAELAGWDDKTLAKLLDELRIEDAMDGTGFSEKELDSLLAEIENDLPPTDLDDPGAGEPPLNPVTQPGDLWILGDHRLLCGDSGSESDVDRLLNGETIHLVNTDPPYNVKVEPRSNNAIKAGLSSFGGLKHHQRFDYERNKSSAKNGNTPFRAKDRPLINDFVSDEEFDRLLHAWFGNMARVLEPGGSFYIWGGYANCGNYPPVLKECGLYFSQAIIWVKEHPVLTRKDFMGNHEWSFYGWKEGKAHRFFGPNNATDVWPIQKINPNKMIHLTEKPAELAVRALTYSSLKGE
ncbi:MAG: ParB N-terminal domain-containing protein, partial [Candidatus Eisenbacteria bacterium]|nr:ParB N-terminal domain-containing protein [Candidatus Eisenbacteria bacterium]